MSKIFEFDARKGSYIDQISGQAGINVNCEFKKTEKGLAWKSNGSDSKLQWEIPFDLSNDWTVEIHHKVSKYNNASWDNPFNISDSQGDYKEGIVFGCNRVLSKDQDGNVISSGFEELDLNKNYHYLVTHSNKVITIYINGEFKRQTVSPAELKTASYINIGYTISRVYNGFVSKATIYDTALTKQEINNLYKQFLRQQPTGTSIYKNDYPIKPTDLSRFKDDTIGETILSNGNFSSGDFTDWEENGAGNRSIISNAEFTNAGRIEIVDFRYYGLKQSVTTNGMYRVKFSYKTNSDKVNIYDGTRNYDLQLNSNEIKETYTQNILLEGSSFFIRFSNGSIGDYLIIDNIELLPLTGLIAAYNMIPSPGGVLTDISGNGNNGTINGAISTKDGMKFDGVDDYVSISSSVNLGINSTINFRINPTYLDVDNEILGEKSNVADWVIRIKNNSIFFKVGAISDFVLFDFINGISYTISIIREGNDGFVYVNGSLAGTLEGFGTSIPTLFDTLGADQNLDTLYYGDIQDMQFYNRALTEQEVKDYHNQFVKPVIVEDFKYDPVGSFPKEWKKGTGEYSVQEYLTTPTFKDDALVNNTLSYKELDGSLTHNNNGYYELTGTSSTVHMYRAFVFRKGHKYRVRARFRNNESIILRLSTRLNAGSTEINVLQTSYRVDTDWTDYDEMFIASGDANGFNIYDNAGLSIGEILYIDHLYIEEIPQLPTGTKYLQCDSAGTAAIQSETAYGEWEFSLYKFTGSNQIGIHFINSDLDKYTLFLTSSDRIALYKESAVTQSDADYIINKVWYDIKIQRTTDGEFTIWAKGGDFGNKYILIDTLTNRNPIVDNEYTKSTYLVVDLDTGDQITNLKVTNGIKQ